MIYHHNPLAWGRIALVGLMRERLERRGEKGELFFWGHA